jgi:hypothetical protein
MRKVRTSAIARQAADGSSAMTAMNSAPGSVMPGEDLGQVALGLGPGSDAGDEATLLAQRVGLLVRGRTAMAV